MKKFFCLVLACSMGLVSLAVTDTTWCYAETGGTLATLNSLGTSTTVNGKTHYAFTVGMPITSYLPTATRTGYSANWYAHVYAINEQQMVDIPIDSTLTYQTSGTYQMNIDSGANVCYFVCKWIEKSTISTLSVYCFTEDGGALADSNDLGTYVYSTSTPDEHRYKFVPGETVSAHLPEATRVGYDPVWWAHIYQRSSGTMVDVAVSDLVFQHNLTGGTTYNMANDSGTYKCWFQCKWTPKSYAVTLEKNGGTINSGNVTEYTYLTGATLPTDVTKTGFTFEGWYADSTFSGARVYQISSSEMGDKTYYAKWTVQVYSVTLETNGGTINSGNVSSYTYGTGATLPTDVTRTGYTFGGWYADSACTGSQVTSIGTTETGNKTYYAKWTQDGYTITLYPNGGTINSGNVTSYTYGQSVTLPTDVTRTGYTFEGWHENSIDGTRVESIGATETGKKTYYAKWTANSYTVTLHYGSGVTVAEGKGVTNYVYGTVTKLPTSSDMTCRGYTFHGWYETSGYEGYVTGQSIPASSTGDVEYWAKWTQNAYQVVFESNDGTEDEYNQDFEYGTTQELLPVDFGREGYTFVEWNTAADGSGTAYADQKRVRNLSAVNDDRVYLYAQWTPNVYSVSFAANGGAGTMEDQEFVWDTAQALDSNAFTREGYLFAGWNTKAKGTGTAYGDGQVVSNLTSVADGTFSLFAQWSAGTYTVAFDANGGEGEMESLGMTVDEAAVLPPCAFTRDGYGFKGWATNDAAGDVVYADGATVSNLTLTADATVSLYAVWTGVTYRVTLQAGTSGTPGFALGSVETNLECTVGEAYPDFPQPTNTSKWVFAGWQPEIPATVLPPSSNLTTFTACWTHLIDPIARVLDLGEDVTIDFSTSGNALWFTNTEDYVQGGSCMQSGELESPSSSTLKAQIKGPGKLSFEYKAMLPWENIINRYPSNDNDRQETFDVTVNGSSIGINGKFVRESVGEWTSASLALPSNETYAIEWVFNRAGNLIASNGWARIDHLVWTPEGSEVQPSVPAGPAGAPALTISPDGTSVQIANTVAGWYYGLYSKTNLTEKTWTRETNVCVSVAGEAVEFTLPIHPEVVSAKFFRIYVEREDRETIAE